MNTLMNTPMKQKVLVGWYMCPPRIQQLGGIDIIALVMLVRPILEFPTACEHPSLKSWTLNGCDFVVFKRPIHGLYYVESDDAEWTDCNLEELFLNIHCYGWNTISNN